MEKQNLKNYIYTLLKYLFLFAHREYGIDFTFQQDNASTHKSSLTRDFFAEQGVDVLD